MTKLRTPISFEDGIDRTVHLLGRSEAEREITVAARTLRAYSDPDDDRQLGIHDALLLDRACQRRGLGTPIFDSYALQLEQSGSSIVRCPVEMARRFTRFVKENGDAISALIGASLPMASEVDRAVALRELRESIDAASAIIPLLEPEPPP